MHELLIRLQNDPELDYYYSLSDDEQLKYEQAVKETADRDMESLKAFCLPLGKGEFSPLSVIYLSLADDFARYGKFLADEFIRVFEEAKTSPDFNANVGCICDLLSFNDYNAETRRILYYLEKQLDVDDPQINLRAIQMIGWWLEEEDYLRELRIMNKIRDFRNHANWKLRYAAYDTLSDFTQTNPRENRLRFSDRLRLAFIGKEGRIK